jgi:hypothetical protein
MLARETLTGRRFTGETWTLEIQALAREELVGRSAIESKRPKTVFETRGISKSSPQWKTPLTVRYAV